MVVNVLADNVIDIELTASLMSNNNATKTVTKIEKLVVFRVQEFLFFILR